MAYPRGVVRLRRFVHELLSLGGTPVGIAGGFSIGVALSLVPIPFAGMLVALALAPILRFNLPATYLGTAVVNPFTRPFIYFAELWLGMTLLGRPTPAFAELSELGVMQWWRLFQDLVVPFMLGGALLSAVALAVCFPAIVWAVRRYRVYRAQHPRKAKHKGDSASAESPLRGPPSD